jgi:uncharacterized phage infection (PIP) family protein YhgE
MGKEREHHPGASIGIRSGIQPMLGVLVAIYIVFAVALAHTAFVAIQGRSTAALGLEASHSSATAFTELKQQIEELRKQLSDTQAGMAASSNTTSSTLHQHLQQMKAEITQQIAQPLQQSSKATDALLDKASKLDERVAELHSKVNNVQDHISAPAAPAQPAGARVEDKELHHIGEGGARPFVGVRYGL